MRNSYEVARAFTLMFFRDRLNLFFTFFFNAFLMVLLGLTVADRYNLQVHVGLSDLAGSPVSRRIAAELRAEPNLKVRSFAGERELAAAVQNGDVVAGIVLDPAAAAGSAGSSARIRLLGDASRKMWAEMLRPGLTVTALKADPSAGPALEAVSVATQEVPGRNLRYFDFLFPGVIAFTIMQISLSGGLTLLRHRKNDALKRLKITPLSRWEFLLGYSASQLFLLTLQVLSYWLLAEVAFGYRLHGSVALVAATVVLGSLLFTSLGLLLSTLAPSMEAGGNLVRFATFPAALLCGVYVPLDTLPRYLAQISFVYPLTPFVDALRSSANHAATLSQNAANLGAMAAVLVVAAGLAVATFRWEEQAV